MVLLFQVTQVMGKHAQVLNRSVVLRPVRPNETVKGEHQPLCQSELPGCVFREGKSHKIVVEAIVVGHPLLMVNVQVNDQAFGDLASSERRVNDDAPRLE